MQFWSRCNASMLTSWSSRRLLASSPRRAKITKSLAPFHGSMTFSPSMASLLEAAKRGRHGTRDHLLVLMMYRHGLRVSEAIDLRRDDVSLDQARLWVRRLKSGLAVEQPITGDELRAIKH